MQLYSIIQKSVEWYSLNGRRLVVDHVQGSRVRGRGGSFRMRLECETTVHGSRVRGRGGIPIHGSSVGSSVGSCVGGSSVHGSMFRGRGGRSSVGVFGGWPVRATGAGFAAGFAA